MATDVSEERAVSFYGVCQSKNSQLMFLECRPWRRRQHAPPKSRSKFTNRNGVESWRSYSFLFRHRARRKHVYCILW